MSTQRAEHVPPLQTEDISPVSQPSHGQSDITSPSSRHLGLFLAKWFEYQRSNCILLKQNLVLYHPLSLCTNNQTDNVYIIIYAV